MASEGPPAIPGLVNITGSLYIASIASTLLFGVTVVQFYIYHIYFNKDNRYLKALVFFIFVLDVFHTVISITQGWIYLAAGWGNAKGLEAMSWVVVCIPVTDGILAFTVQMFYAWRIWFTKQWRIVPAFISIAALTQLVSVIYISIRLSTFTLLPEIQEKVGTPLTIWMVGGMVADIAVVVAMSIILLSVGKGTDNPRPRSVNRILLLTVESNAATTVVAISILVLFYASDTTWFWFLVTSLIIGKVYANTLLVSLNSRLRTRVGGGSTTHSSHEGSSTTAPVLRGMSFKQPTEVMMTVTSYSGSRGDTETYQTDDANFKPSDVQKDYEGAVVLNLHPNQETTHGSTAV